MLMSQKIKFAVVGCGHIGKRHAEMISRNSDCELVALVDIKPKDALNIGQYNVPFFSGLSDLLNAAIDIDVICIASPNGLHAEQAMQCNAFMHANILY